MSLKRYRKMRHFDATPEPDGSSAEASKHPIFVVQLHHARRRHYDFRLQVGDTLKSWAVPKGPSFDPSVKRLAVEVEDHPLDYADFEGQIPEGNYGAGDVAIFDHGFWAPVLDKGDANAQLATGHLRFSLVGEKLRGDWDLIRTRPKDNKPQWLLKKVDDDEAGNFEADDLLGDPEAEPPRTRIWHSNRAANRPAPTVRLTHGERVVYPALGLTKAEVFAYYHAVAPLILPELENRPMSVVRCPKGVAGPSFFQKHPMKGWGPHVLGSPIAHSDGTIEDTLYIDSEEGLLEMAQMNVIELHAWGSHIADPDLADRLVIDLDPADDVPWQRVTDAARIVHDLLESVGLQSFARLSGGKGFHIVVPIHPPAPWDAAKQFTQHVAHVLAAGRPAEFIEVMTKARRAGKIFVDYLRNGRGATSVVSYSLRKNAEASVAMPVEWSELGKIEGPRAFSLQSALQKLAQRKRDPWAGIDEVRQELPTLK